MESLMLSRRHLLAGGAGLGVGLLTRTLNAKTLRDDPPKSLLTIWLAGGPSQIETWDPHPGARIGGSTTAIKTSVADVSIAHLLPRMAERMHHLSIVRSLVSREGDHQRGRYAVRTGYRMQPTVDYPSLGAIALERSSAPDLEIPAYVSLGGQPSEPGGGFLGTRYDAFRVANPGGRLDNLESHVDEERQTRRLANLDVVTGAFRDPSTNEQHQRRADDAVRMMRSEQLEAFRLDDESQRVHDAYGTDRFGRSCLTARRLLEAGVRSVEVTLDGFDSHVANHETHQERCAILDRGFAALLDDLVQRDLLKRTVVVCVGEFGRTPKINGLDGRDHWPHGFSAVVGGGGLRGGHVIGATDPTGERRAPKDPVSIAGLAATLLLALGHDPTTERYTPAGRPIRLSGGRPIRELFV